MRQKFEFAGETFEGFLALPESGTGRGLLVFHAWWGLNDFFVSIYLINYFIYPQATAALFTDPASHSCLSSPSPGRPYKAWQVYLQVSAPS